MSGIIRLGFITCVVTAFVGCSQPASSENGETETEPPPQEAASPTPPPRQLTEKERKRKSEVERLMLMGEYLHDGSGELADIGDEDSVPALLVVLKKNPVDANGMMVCTRAHALMALSKITGANPGNQNGDWETWWQQRQQTSDSQRNDR